MANLKKRSGGSFFRLSFESNPYHTPEASAILSLDMLPLDIVLNRPILDEIGSIHRTLILLTWISMSLAAVFSREEEAEEEPSAFLLELQEKAKKQVQDLTDATKASVKSAFKDRRRFLMNVNAYAPNLIIPEVLYASI